MKENNSPFSTLNSQLIPPGYKQTEVGVIPEDWDISSLEYVATSNGLVRGPFGGALKKEFFIPRGYKVYEQRNAIYGSTEIGSYFIDGNKYRELIRFDVKPGDFIVSCSGTIGCIYRIPSGAPEGVINQALLKISVDTEKVDPYYFFITFQSPVFQSRIKENTHGGAMQNLVGMVIFRQAPLPLPSKQEQTAIATALSDVDALLEGLEAHRQETRPQTGRHAATPHRQNPPAGVWRGVGGEAVGGLRQILA